TVELLLIQSSRVLGSGLPRPAFGHEQSMLRKNNTLRQPAILRRSGESGAYFLRRDRRRKEPHALVPPLAAGCGLPSRISLSRPDRKPRGTRLSGGPH